MLWPLDARVSVTSLGVTGNLISVEQLLECPLQLPESVAKDLSHPREPVAASGTFSGAGIGSGFCAISQSKPMPRRSLKPSLMLPVVCCEDKGTTTAVALLLEHPLQLPESLSREERSHP
jgi:hypothetical protein